MMQKGFIVITLAALLFSAQSFSQMPAPDCLDNGETLQFNNDSVLNWKSNTANQYHDRAYIQGNLVKAYPDHSGHHHYEVRIGANPSDLVEVIYNEQFGALPNDIKPGAKIKACGDYITSNKPSGSMPASPDGAIVHWIHSSNDLAKHDSGFLIINDIIYGQKNGPNPLQSHSRF